jgi:hypothetical protein
LLTSRQTREENSFFHYRIERSHLNNSPELLRAAAESSICQPHKTLLGFIHRRSVAWTEWMSTVTVALAMSRSFRAPASGSAKGRLLAYFIGG